MGRRKCDIAEVRCKKWPLEIGRGDNIPDIKYDRTGYNIFMYEWLHE